jgi:signal peptidase
MTTKKLLSLTCKVALGLLLAVIVGALAVLTVVPRAVHGSALTVLTGSMTPTIPVGSVVVVRPVDASQRSTPAPRQ